MIEIEAGQEYGYWKVLNKTDKRTSLCLCLGCCHISREILDTRLRTGKTRSCGCKRSEVVKQKSLEKHGIEWPNQSPSAIEKKKKTCLLKYGYENPSKNLKVQEKKRSTLIQKYGVDQVSKIPHVRKKIEATCFEKYGVKSPLQNEKIKKKAIATNIERYGVDNPIKLQIFQEKTKITNLRKFGVEYPAQNPEVMLKRDQTNFEKYGCRNPIGNPEVASKAKKTKQDLGIWYKDYEVSEKFKEYSRTVRGLTETSIRQNTDKFKKRGKDFHVDHIFTIKDGFSENIPPQIIANIVNLQLLDAVINSLKRTRSWITKEELYRRIKEIKND